MTGYTKRYLQLCEARGEKALVVGDVVFRPRSGMILPFGPAKRDLSVTEPQARDLLRRLGGVLVRWTSGFDPSRENLGSYAVICDELKPLEALKFRSQIRRGLECCEVKRIDAEFLSRNGYDVFIRALDRYGKRFLQVPDEAWYRKRTSLTKGFEDIVHHWGAFYQGTLVGYSTNYVLGKTEVNYSTLKFRPEYLPHRPSHALFYKMNEHYLEREGFEYVNAGFRCLLHASRIQDFLEEKLGFRRAPLRLNVVYRQPFSFLVKATLPFKDVLRRLDPRLAAVYELETIRGRGLKP